VLVHARFPKLLVGFPLARYKVDDKPQGKYPKITGSFGGINRGTLKKLLAEAELDKAILKEAASGNY